MKTTKQIYLLMEKKGRELAALAEGLDKIIVTEETLRNMFDGKETDSVNALPILEKGVSVQAGDKIKDYLIFEVMDREEDSFKIHCESYQEYCGKDKPLPAATPLWAYTADISVSFGCILSAERNYSSSIFNMERNGFRGKEHTSLY